MAPLFLFQKAPNREPGRAAGAAVPGKTGRGTGPKAGPPIPTDFLIFIRSKGASKVTDNGLPGDGPGLVAGKEQQDVGHIVGHTDPHP